MLDDRREIWSPGKLPPLQRDERRGYDPFCRNTVIARVLVELSYIAEGGLGICRMREEMASHGLPELEFREGGFSFVITLRSIVPREGVAAPADTFRALVERGEIAERQLYGRERAAHGCVGAHCGSRPGGAEWTGMQQRARAEHGLPPVGEWRHLIVPWMAR